MLPVESPFKTYTDVDGKPLENGYVYFGVANQNPITSPVTVYWDAAGTQPAAQPLRTVGGYIMRAGTPANVFYSGSYSELVQDHKGRQVFFARTSTDFGIATIVQNFLTNLASSAGASLIGFIQAGVGAILLTVQTKLRQSVHIEDFGGVGDDATDNLLAMQKAHAASLFVDYGGKDKVYRTSGTVTLRDGSVMFGKGATIKQMTDDTEIFNMEAKSDISATGLKFSGKGDYSDSDSSRACAFYGGTSGARIHITRCYFYNFGYTSARFKAQNDCSFTFNTVEGPGYPTLTAVTSGKNYGALFDAGCQGVLVHGNDISKTAQGVRIEQVRDCRITSNRLYSITGQHGVYAGSGLLNTLIANNTIHDVDLIGIKVQAQDTALVDNINTVITANTVYDCGDQGIMTCNGSVGATYKCRNVTITGNSVRLVAGSGVVMNNTIGAVVGTNALDLCGFSGITWSESSMLKIDSNVITRSGLSAMRDVIACTQVSITNNKVQDCCTAVAGTDQNGLFLQGGTEYNISSNEFGDTGATMKYGVYLAGGTMETFTVDDNLVTAATDCGLRLASTAAMRSYQGNHWAGTLAATFNDPEPPSVVAAATLTLPSDWGCVVVTGATPVTYINPNGHSGRTVVLFPDASVDIRDGGNLLLNGNFAATANDTLTLACDGANWREVNRSAN
jgi:hypothetical protein